MELPIIFLLIWQPFVTSEISLAIIAQESMGNPRAVSEDGHYSRGLMQVICSDWMGIDCEKLFEPEYNIEWGEWLLEEALDYSHGNLYIALQVYNCGPERYEKNKDCGVYYADRVMYKWLPLIEKYSILEE